MVLYLLSWVWEYSNQAKPKPKQLCTICGYHHRLLEAQNPMEEPVQGAMGGYSGARVCGSGAQDLYPVRCRQGGEAAAGGQDGSPAAWGGGQAEAARDGKGLVLCPHVLLLL